MTHPFKSSMTVDTCERANMRRKLKINLRTLWLWMWWKKMLSTMLICLLFWFINTSTDVDYVTRRVENCWQRRIANAFIRKKTLRFNSCSCSYSPSLSYDIIIDISYENSASSSSKLTMTRDIRVILSWKSLTRELKEIHTQQKIVVKYQWTISWLRTDTGIRREYYFQSFEIFLEVWNRIKKKVSKHVVSWRANRFQISSDKFPSRANAKKARKKSLKFVYVTPT